VNYAIRGRQICAKPFIRVRQVLEVRLVVEERMGLIRVRVERVADGRADRQLRRPLELHADGELRDRRSTRYVGVNSALSAVAVTTLLTSTKPDDSGPMVRTGAAVLLTGALFAELVTWTLYEPSPSRYPAVRRLVFAENYWTAVVEGSTLRTQFGKLCSRQAAKASAAIAAKRLRGSANASATPNQIAAELKLSTGTTIC
jgi:hypothetical protein